MRSQTFTKTALRTHGGVALTGGTLHLTGALESSAAITIGAAGTPVHADAVAPCYGGRVCQPCQSWIAQPR